jgi:hypothetical protein
METIKKLFYIVIWVLILSWFLGIGWAITIIIASAVLNKIFHDPGKPRKTKVPLAAKTAASAYIGYKAGKKIGKW